MSNHIHLLLRQIKDVGITRFMRKVGAGYGRYFNTKYKRKGYVFQNRFRSVCIENNKQLVVIFNYIHANPISLVEPNWKENGIRNSNKAIKFLNDYKWSSYCDYIGVKNFSSVTKRDFMLEFLDGPKGCEESLGNWIEYKKALGQSKNLFLE